MKNPFYYKGTIPASKSMMNRLLICQTYKKSLIIHGESQCDDVVLMKKALNQSPGKELYCGSAGTVLRFLSFKASRIKGEHLLTGTDRLFSRPIDDLLKIMKQLNVQVQLTNKGLVIKSNGWESANNKIDVPRGKSSQFLSGLLLNCWELSDDITFTWQGDVVSDGYLQMTIDCLSSLGMEIRQSNNSIFVPKGQTIKTHEATAESDLSSAFAVAALAVVGGEAEFLNFPYSSRQPDLEFVAMLKAMKVDIIEKESGLIIKKTTELSPIEWNINNCPDLFPVLAILCSQAKGTSVLSGAPHLGYKESDRLGKTAELLTKMNIQFEIIPGGMRIFGQKTTAQPFTYDTDEDHRLAFAAGVAQWLGYKITVGTPGVVSKSFPEFWQIHGGQTF